MACSNLLATFHEESEPHYEEMSRLMLLHLSDNMYLVRMKAAKAICNVYCFSTDNREELLARFDQHLTENLLKAKEQPAYLIQPSRLPNEDLDKVAARYNELEDYQKN